MSMSLLKAVGIGLLFLGVTALAVLATRPLSEPSVPTPTSTPTPQAFAPPFSTSTRAVFDLIRVTSPKKGDRIRSPLIVRGEARGNWYFEASFPIRLKDSAGTVIATAVAQAKGEWMTDRFVPFEATLVFEIPKKRAEGGTLVLEKDNPSGLPQYDVSLEVPVEFALPKARASRTKPVPCFAGGCSRELCTDRKDLISACIFSPEYECYRTAVCARQANGKCGWTETPELQRCIAEKQSNVQRTVY